MFNIRMNPVQRLRGVNDIEKLLALADEFASELARLQGFGLTPQRGSHHVWVPLEDSSVLVEYEYTPGTPGRLSGPPEDCYEAEPEEVTLLNVLVNGHWIDANQFSESTLDMWDAAIREHITDQRESAEEDRAEAHWLSREAA